MEFGNLIVWLPLLIAVVVVLFATFNIVKKGFPLDDAQKDVIKEGGKSFLYLLLVAYLLRWVMPALGTFGMIFGTIVTTALAAAVIITVVNLPNRLNALHDLAWREGRKTPIYSRSGHPVENVRWVRRLSLLVFVLFAFIVTLAGGGSADQVRADGASPLPTATTDSPAPIPSTKTESAAPANVVTPVSTLTVPCPGNITLTSVAVPPPIKFGPDLQICHDNSWQDWDEAKPGQEAPRQVLLQAWTTESDYGYGKVVDDGGNSYFIQTKNFS